MAPVLVAGSLALAVGWAIAADGAARTERDAAGLPVGTVRSATEDATGAPREARTDRCFDAAGRLVLEEGPSTVYRRLVLDALGRPVAEYDRAAPPNDLVVTRAYDVRGAVFREEDAAGVVTLRGVDAAGHVLCEGTYATGATPLASATIDAPATQVCGVADAARLTRWKYGETGELLAVAPPGVAGFAAGTVRYGYDARRRVTSRTDAEGHEVTYGYADARFPELRTSLTQAGTTTWTTTYDSNRRAASQVDPLGNTGTFASYRLRQPTSISYTGPNATGTSPSGVTLAYDDNGALLSRTLARVDTTEDTETWTRDVEGRPETYTLETDAGGAAVTTALAWRYHLDGSRAEVTLPGGTRAGYLYDVAGRLERTTQVVGAADFTTEHATTPEGLPTRTLLGDGSTTCRSYDAADRLTYVGHTLATDACDALPLVGPLRAFAYGHDAFGNRNQVDELWRSPTEGTLHSEATTFAYDGRDRLTAAAYGDLAVRYVYDGNGNRTRETTWARDPGVTAATYAAGGVPGPTVDHDLAYDLRDRLTTIDDRLTGGQNVVTYAYDAAGRTTSRTTAAGATTYAWNADGTMRDAVDPSSTRLGLYAYDPSLLRRRKLSSAPSEGDRLYVYDGSSLVAELDAATGAPKLTYLYGTELLGVADATGGSTVVEWVHRDGMRSVVERTASAGASAVRVAGPFRYDAFGTQRATGTASVMATDGRSKVAYTGHVLDAETGLVYAKARYLVPELGRFHSQDPYEGEAGQAPSLHRYAYAPCVIT